MPGPRRSAQSLSIGQGDDGRALVHCHAGCSPEAVVIAVGLTLRDLMMPNSNSNGHQNNGHHRNGTKKPPMFLGTIDQAVAGNWSSWWEAVPSWSSVGIMARFLSCGSTDQLRPAKNNTRSFARSIRPHSVRKA